jgi:hypothetical protein
MIPGLKARLAPDAVESPAQHDLDIVADESAKNDPAWFQLMLKASESGVNSEAELADLRKEMSEDQYQQEFECSFEAAIKGAFNADEMRTMGMTEKLRQDALALLDWRAPQVLAVEFEEVERAEHGGGIMTVSADQVENGKAALVVDGGLAVDQA